MNINFQKYHGTGNDFVMIDNRSLFFDPTNQSLISQLCDRHFGIGADGLILLELSEKHDFYMRYFNADGLEGSMCGNGGRCTVHFAKSLGIIADKTTFKAFDGLHYAEIENDEVSLKMGNVSKIEIHQSHSFINTGSPHHVEIVTNLASYPVYEIGKQKRFGAPYFESGSNINFIEAIDDNTYKMRTYERGVENETLSCGTGATAAAIAMYEIGKSKSTKITIEVLGGVLEISFDKKGSVYENVYLKGKATFVFKGTYEFGF